MVVELTTRENGKSEGFTVDNKIHTIEEDEVLNIKYVVDYPDDIIAVKILGVTAEYGAQLGMEVIEL